ncbi:hypothetical protein [Christensenella timonensis]|uniref:hypothetical protein n=1 Tax=Christensenella timonensis TaxID=1816678 RepID=UPI0008339549|nr:hypothetical protein [Christensenella timonensis]
MSKSLSEVFSSAWSMAKRNFVALFVPTVIYVGVVLLLYGINASGELTSLTRMDQAGYVPQGAPIWTSAVMFAISVFLAPLYSGFITAVLRGTSITGKPTPMRAAWQAACANYTKYLLTTLTQILFGFVFAMVIAVIAVVAVFVSALQNMVDWAVYSPDVWEALATLFSALFPAIVIMAVIGWFYQFSQMFLSYIPGMEQTQGFKAFFSSFRYIYRGNFLKNLGHILLAEVIQGLITGLVAVIFFLPFFVNLGMCINMDSLVTAEQILHPLMWGLPLYMLVGGLVSSLMSVFFTPYYFEVYQSAKAETDRREAAKGAAIPQYPYGR